MRRREVLQLLAGAAVATPFSAAADTPPKMARLGTLSPTLPLDEKSLGGMILLKTLQQRGYTLGKNLTFEARATNGQVAKLGEAARNMKAEQIDAVVVIGFPTVLACKVANVPTVVAFGCGDPVATHLINSLARPGGVVTGISDDAAALSTKRLALIKQAVPNVRRVAMLWNRDDLGMTMRYESSSAAAQSLGVAVQPLGVREPNDFNGVFEAMDSERPDAILMVADSLTGLNRKRVFDYANAHGIPAMYEYDFFVRDGGLMSYGATSRNHSNAPPTSLRAFSAAQNRAIYPLRNQPITRSWSI